MERYTCYENGKAVLKLPCDGGMEYSGPEADRLAAYEDTGLTPEEIIKRWAETLALKKEYDEYRSAEADGRLVVLPCKVGSAVYGLERDEDGKATDISGYMLLAQTGDAVVCSAYINRLKTAEETIQYHINETAENYYTDLAVFPLCDCYLTREEANTALAKEKTT